MSEIFYNNIIYATLQLDLKPMYDIFNTVFYFALLIHMQEHIIRFHCKIQVIIWWTSSVKLHIKYSQKSSHFLNIFQTLLEKFLFCSKYLILSYLLCSHVIPVHPDLHPPLHSPVNLSQELVTIQFRLHWLLQLLP